MVVDLQPRVEGTWANEMAPWGELSISSRWPGGNLEASWKMYFSPGARHASLHKGALVEIAIGSGRTFLGKLAQPDWNEGTFKADGLYAEANAFSALNSSGSGAALAQNAMAQAIVRGAAWTGSSGWGGAPAATGNAPTDGLNTCAQIMDAVADEVGKRWAVWEDGIVILAADATDPTWQIAPGLVEFGVDDTVFATQLNVRYIDSTTMVATTYTQPDAAAIARYGVVEEGIDLTEWGAMSATKVQTKALGILAKGRSRLGWTNSVTVGPSELTTMAGNPADLSMVRAGQVVRAFGIWDEFKAVPYRDLVIGQCTYTPSEGTVTLAPVDTQPQTPEEIIEDLVRKARTKPPRG